MQYIQCIDNPVASGVFTSLKPEISFILTNFPNISNIMKKGTG